MEHTHLIQVTLVGLGIAQALFIFLFGLIWSRLGELDKDIKKHHEDIHAHGNGMPRGESLARFQALESKVLSLETEQRAYCNGLNTRLDNIAALLINGRKSNA